MNGQRGFGAIAAIVVLVILAVLGSAIVAFSTNQQVTSAQDVMSIRAWQAARAGNEWGLFQALQPAGIWTEGAAADPCPAAGALGAGVMRTATLDLVADTGFNVAVTGECWRYNEGESFNLDGTVRTLTTVRVYRIAAVACSSAVCPDSAAAAGMGYVERRRVVLATN